MMNTVHVSESGHIINEQEICVKLTNGDEISGTVNIAEYDCKRLSDLFTSENNDYIILSQCNNDHKVMFINKRHILWAVPLKI